MDKNVLMSQPPHGLKIIFTLQKASVDGTVTRYRGTYSQLTLPPPFLGADLRYAPH